MCPDIWAEESCENQGEEGVYVHRQLKWRKVVACENGEDAVEAGDFIEEEREGDEACACLEREDVEE